MTTAKKKPRPSTSKVNVKVDSTPDASLLFALDEALLTIGSHIVFGALKVAHHNDYYEDKPSDKALMHASLHLSQELISLIKVVGK